MFRQLIVIETECGLLVIQALKAYQKLRIAVIKGTIYLWILFYLVELDMGLGKENTFLNFTVTFSSLFSE